MTALFSCLFAAIDTIDPLSETPFPTGGDSEGFLTSQLRELLPILGVILVISLVLFLWAYATRKNRQRQSAAARGSRMVTRAKKETPHAGEPRRRVRRRRREQAENLQRNPTLAEAGGLPPPRPEEPDPPPDTPVKPAQFPSQS